MIDLIFVSRNLLRSIILVLTIAAWPSFAQASLVSYDLNYIRGHGLTSFNTFVDVTITLDDDDILGGISLVSLSTIDVIFRQGTEELSHSFSNDRTNTITGSGVFNTTYVPYVARFDGNSLTGLIGIQPVEASHIGIASLSFATPVPIVGGSQAGTRFHKKSLATAAFGDQHGALDLSPLGGVSGPVAVVSGPVVPVPAAFWLFGTAIVSLFGLRKRRTIARYFSPSHRPLGYVGVR